jgi:sigma-E factor negative regulatory protein RseB
LTAKAWLMRSQTAASTRNYQGTLVFTGGGAVSSSRVAHYCEGSQQYERVEALDGEPRSMWRHNDLVQTVWPRVHMAVIEQRDPRAMFPALLSGSAASGCWNGTNCALWGMTAWRATTPMSCC